MTETSVTIDRFGRVLIPKPVRDRHAWKSGTVLTLDDVADADAIQLGTADSPSSSGGVSMRGGNTVYESVWVGPPLHPDLDPVQILIDADRAHRAGLV